MIVGEANEFRPLLLWALGRDIPNDTVREAAAYLADRAYKTLLCGLTGDEVRQQWPATSPAEDRAELERLAEPPPDVLPEDRDAAVTAWLDLSLRWRFQQERADTAERERDEALAKIEQLRWARDAVTDPFARIGIIVDEWQENGGDPYDAMKAVAEQVGEP